jgi:hypothetical protein
MSHTRIHVSQRTAFAAIASAFLLCGAMARRAEAQPSTTVGQPVARSFVRGWIRDSLKHRVPRATVVPTGFPLQTTTDDSGYFSVGPIPAGIRQFEVRRLGYAPETFDVFVPDSGGTTIDVTISEVAVTLADVNVRRRELPNLTKKGFYERRAKKVNGTFLMPDDVDKRQAQHASDFLQQVLGVRVLGMAGRRRVMLANTNCDMAIFIDGHYVRSGRDRRGTNWGSFDETVMARDVYAMEVYRNAPGEFQAPSLSGQAFCGAVVIWTRLYEGT